MTINDHQTTKSCQATHIDSFNEGSVIDEDTVSEINSDWIKNARLPEVIGMQSYTGCKRSLIK